jgi:hypothetical protein
VERVAADGTRTPLARELVSDLDTLIVISFDSTRTGQRPDAHELDTLRRFLEVPGNLLIVAPHHNIGDDPEVEFRHHGDRTIPPEQRFGGFASSILGSLGVPVNNRYGLRPAASPDGSPAPIEIAHEADRLRLLDGPARREAAPPGGVAGVEALRPGCLALGVFLLTSDRAGVTPGTPRGDPGESPGVTPRAT